MYMRPAFVSTKDASIDWIHARVMGFNDEEDLAILEVSEDLKPPVLLVANPQEYKFRIGEEVITVGHPYSVLDAKSNKMSHSYLLRQGYFAGTEGDDFIVDMGLDPGNSGGPLINQDGEVIGVISRGRQTLGYAVNLDTVHKFTSKKESRTASMYDGKSSFDFIYSSGEISEAFLKSNHADQRYGYRSIELRFDFKDRFVIGYEMMSSVKIGQTDHIFQRTKLGWRFMPSDLSDAPFFVTPFYGTTNIYRNDEKGEYFGPSITRSFGGLNIELGPIYLEFISHGNSEEDFSRSIGIDIFALFTGKK
jgi:hypothetical protein